MQTITVRTKNGPLTVQTSLTLQQAAAVLAPHTGDSFAQDLVRAYRQYGDQLTSGRANWMLIKAQRLLKPEPQVKIGGMRGVLDLLSKAQMNFKKPAKIRLQLADGTPCILFMAGANSAHRGKVNVVSGPYPAPMFGRIDTEGNFSGKNPEVIALLTRLAADPAGVASEYGKLVGSCCFCGLALTDDRSLQVGYGRQCASNYDLPWGERPEQTMMEKVVSDLKPVAGGTKLASLLESLANEDEDEDEDETPVTLEWLLERATAYSGSYI